MPKRWADGLDIPDFQFFQWQPAGPTADGMTQGTQQPIVITVPQIIQEPIYIQLPPEQIIQQEPVYIVIQPPSQNPTGVTYVGQPLPVPGGGGGGISPYIDNAVPLPSNSPTLSLSHVETVVPSLPVDPNTNMIDSTKTEVKTFIRNFLLQCPKISLFATIQMGSDPDVEIFQFQDSEFKIAITNAVLAPINTINSTIIPGASFMLVDETGQYHGQYCGFGIGDTLSMYWADDFLFITVKSWNNFIVSMQDGNYYFPLNSSKIPDACFWIDRPSSRVFNGQPITGKYLYGDFTRFLASNTSGSISYSALPNWNISGLILEPSGIMPRHLCYTQIASQSVSNPRFFDADEFDETTHAITKLFSLVGYGYPLYITQQFPDGSYIEYEYIYLMFRTDGLPIFS